MTVDLNIPDEFDMPAARLAARRQRVLAEVTNATPASTRRAGGGRLSVRSLLPSWGRRRALALALVGAVLAAVAAGAATGVLTVGTQLPTERVSGKGEPRYTSERTIVATGVTSNGLDWRMTVAKTSNQGFCFGLTLFDTVVGDSGTDACGRSSTFDALGVGGGDVLPDTTLVFGPVPEQADAVRLSAPGGFTRTITDFHDGPTDAPGNFYFAEVPRGVTNVLVEWLNPDGVVERPGTMVESTIKYRPQPPDDHPH